jgi:class 3 adenylate cyclase
MEFRIGIHLGEVQVQDDRLFGMGVNIAARLEALADPCGVCISARGRGARRPELEAGAPLDSDGVDGSPAAGRIESAANSSYPLRDSVGRESGGSLPSLVLDPWLACCV